MPDSPTRSFAHPADLLLERRVPLPDEDTTVAFGARFARAIEAVVKAKRGVAHEADEPFAGLQVQLTGDLGAGKTTLVRATLRALGHSGRVRSPTYTLVEPYSLALDVGSLDLYHFDLYRFADPAEWADAGFREYFDAGAICLVEWPQKAGGLLGVPDLEFMLEQEGEGRVLIARAFSETGKTCLESC
jgi:tRNA threonylcarbamoyladenosine biosynthesis protein TsaE